jgi:hypothetical protein
VELSPGAALCLYHIARKHLAMPQAFGGKESGGSAYANPTLAFVFLSLVRALAATPTRPENQAGWGGINTRERVLQLNGTFEFDSPRTRNHGESEVPFRPAS